MWLILALPRIRIFSMGTLDQKCRYHEICKYYRKFAVTCEKDDEAKGYCRKYREFAKIESTVQKLGQ